MLGIAIPSSMQGRPLVEALRVTGNQRPRVTKMQRTARTKDGSYSQTAFFSIVRAGRNEYRYLDYAQATRKSQTP